MLGQARLPFRTPDLDSNPAAFVVENDQPALLAARAGRDEDARADATDERRAALSEDQHARAEDVLLVEEGLVEEQADHATIEQLDGALGRGWKAGKDAESRARTLRVDELGDRLACMGKALEEAECAGA